jgi:hypothetical protein
MIHLCVYSFRSLEELSLKGNKVTIAPNYRGFTKHLIASLKQLDGKSLYLRDGNRCPGYGVRFECMHTVNDVDTETVMTQINSHCSVSTQGIPPAAAHVCVSDFRCWLFHIHLTHSFLTYATPHLLLTTLSLSFFLSPSLFFSLSPSLSLFPSLSPSLSLSLSCCCTIAVF